MHVDQLEKNICSRAKNLFVVLSHFLNRAHFLTLVSFVLRSESELYSNNYEWTANNFLPDQLHPVGEATLIKPRGCFAVHCMD
jgi:hypothetical protein